MTREFLIQRFCEANWPPILGLRPFIVRGPSFEDWMVAGSLERHLEYRFIPALRQSLNSLGTESTPELRRSIAELLLREGILRALWTSAEDSARVMGGLSKRELGRLDSIEYPADRWLASIDEVVAEIPTDSPVGDWVVEYLSGITDEGHVNHMLVEDGFTFVPQEVPTET